MAAGIALENAMTVEGVVMNGRVIATAPESWPDGSRVSVALLQDDDLDAELAAMPPPPETETQEEFLESLRQSIADIKAGKSRGRPVDEVFRRYCKGTQSPEGAAGVNHAGCQGLAESPSRHQADHCENQRYGLAVISGQMA